MLLGEMMMQAKLADLYRTIDGRHGNVQTAAVMGRRLVARQHVVTESPRADATRMLGQWLATRRAAAR
jgi:hypothetical protein